MRDLTREGRKPSVNGAALVVDTALPSGAVPEPEAFQLPPGDDPGPVPRPSSPAVAIDAEALSQRVADILEPRVRDLVSERRGAWALRMMAHVRDVALLVEPITRIAVARILTLGALVAAVGLAGWTLYLAAGWERIAALGAVLGFLLPLAWRGQPKAPAEPQR